MAVTFHFIFWSFYCWKYCIAVKFYVLKFLAFCHCRNVKRAGGWWSEMPSPIASSPSRGWPCSRRPRWVSSGPAFILRQIGRCEHSLFCSPWFLLALSRWSLTLWPQPLVPTTTLCTSWVMLTWDVTKNTNSVWMWKKLRQTATRIEFTGLCLCIELKLVQLNGIAAMESKSIGWENWQSTQVPSQSTLCSSCYLAIQILDPVSAGVVQLSSINCIAFLCMFLVVLHRIRHSNKISWRKHLLSQWFQIKFPFANLRSMA